MKSSEIKLFFKEHSNNTMLVGVFILAILVMTLMDNQFLSVGTLESIGYQLPELGILSIAMMITMIPGGINLSSIASANLSGIVMAIILTKNVTKGEDKIGITLLAVAVGISVSALIGLLNGIIIAFFRVPAILATLGTQMLVIGLCNVITKGGVISGYPSSFRFIGSGDLGGIPVPLIILIISSILAAFILYLFPVGSQAYMYGSNASATLFSGIDTKAMLIKIYVLSGIFAGVAAIILTSRFNSAATGYADSYLLQTVLIAVLGGVNPNGGSGKVSGILLAVLILQTISIGLNILMISQYLTIALWGMILLGVVAVRTIFSRFLI